MKLGKLNINLITQKLVTSTKLIKNKFKGSVLFEKYEPHKGNTLSAGFFVSGGTVTNSLITFSSSNIITIGLDKGVGGYDIGGNGSFILKVLKKPNFFHRNMIKLVFGWKYINNK